MTVPVGKPIWSRTSSIDYYGGSLSKTDNTTEATTPLSYLMYRSIQGALGSAFNQCPAGLVHAQNLAIGRAASAAARAAEKLSANSRPSSSDESLRRWAQYLGVDFSAADSAATVRAKTESKLKLISGPISYVIDSILRSLLLAIFIETIRNHDNPLDVPPVKTYWPFINPGPQEYNLTHNGATGPWSSERNHLTVIVSKPSFMSDNDFFKLLNGEFTKQMDLILPAYVSFSWAVEDSRDNGFTLGLSRLDYDSITNQ